MCCHFTIPKTQTQLTVWRSLIRLPKAYLKADHRSYTPKQDIINDPKVDHSNSKTDIPSAADAPYNALGSPTAWLGARDHWPWVQVERESIIEQMDTKQTIRMNPGAGETSYARNSIIQVGSFSYTSAMNFFTSRCLNYLVSPKV